ncbi:DNA-processing protein DprA [Leucobacter triazinivorans]|uniref:DNA-processing protein DprA n=1 Tax=Leucobacter triazinivorans TaxID=1784719 RepID=A0A4P6KDT9_9MICO|nr:DNA-processing protein DprA [Leucobacter triazinivorans]QBE48250.1 DNA-processing protein DprA [Leucobacter triazinivorans]
MSERFALARIDDERTARVALSYIIPLGHEITGGLLQAHGAVQTLRFALGEQPRGLDAAALAYWRNYFSAYNPAHVDRSVQFAREQGLTLVTPDDADWPTALDALGSRAPYALWIKGSRPELLTRPLSERVSIIGVRSASGRGMYDADRLAVGLSLQDVTIVSTASPGIARAALSGPQRGPGGAITVLTHALEDPDAITPNGFLASIGENGLLVSECPPGRAPGRDSLQSQRRIVAALSAVTTVIESGPQGEAVQTARIASALHRQVAVVEGEPGSIGNLGPRLLLEEYGATPVRNRDDVATLLTVKPLAALSDLMPQANRATSPNPSPEAPAGRPQHTPTSGVLTLSR